MKRTILTILFILAISICYAQEKTTIKGVEYHKMNERFYEKTIYINGEMIRESRKLYKDTYWLEGGGKDTNNDGVIQNFTRVCLMEKRVFV